MRPSRLKPGHIILNEGHLDFGVSGAPSFLMLLIHSVEPISLNRLGMIYEIKCDPVRQKSEAGVDLYSGAYSVKVRCDTKVTTVGRLGYQDIKATLSA